MPRKPAPARTKISSQEREAIRLRGTGLSLIDIGKAMSLTPGTVKSYLNKAYKILGARDGAHALGILYGTGELVPEYASAQIEALHTERQEILNQDAYAKLQVSISLPRQRLSGSPASRLGQVAGTLDTIAQSAEDLHPELAASLERMAREISWALAEPSAEDCDPHLAFDKHRETYGLPPIPRELLTSILDGHPEIGQIAEVWGWADSEVLTKISAWLYRDVIGLNAEQFQAALTNDPDALRQAFIDLLPYRS